MPRQPRPASIAGAGVVVFLGFALGLSGCGGGHRAAATPTTVDAPTAAPTTQPPGPYAWSPVASPPLAAGGGPSSGLAAVVAPDASDRWWVVAGSRMGADGSSTATVWSSTDLHTWSSAALTGPQVVSTARAAARLGAATVVVGSVGTGAEQRATIWLSAAPGTPFVPVPTGDLPPTAGRALTAVSGGGLGWFAAGRSGSQVSVWYSTNGRRWSTLAGAADAINDAAGPHVTSLVATSGGVLAAGWEPDGARTVAAVWKSSDGVVWHRVTSAAAAFAGPGDRFITAVAAITAGPTSGGATPYRYVAVGGIRTGGAWQPASWISPDGATWSLPSLDFPAPAATAPGPAALYPGGPAGGRVVRAVSVSNSGVLTAAGGGPGGQVLWRSTDGAHWSEVPLPARVASAGWQASLVATTGGMTAVADGRPGQPHLVVDGPQGWVEPSANPALFGPVEATAQPTALSTVGGRMVMAVAVTTASQEVGPAAISTAIFTATSVGAWQRMPAGGSAFSGATVTGFSAAAGRLVAVGWQMGGGGSAPRAVAWTSADGRSWSAPIRLDATPEAGAASEAAFGSCIVGRDVAAVGAKRAEVPTTSGPGRPARLRMEVVPRAWVSSDGVHWRAVPAGSPGRSTSAALVGCAPAPTGIAAYGAATPAGATDAVPAYWTGSTARWLPAGASPWVGAPAPIADLATAPVSGPATATGRSWLAVAGGSAFPLGAHDVLAVSAPAGASWRTVDTSLWGPPDLVAPAVVTWAGDVPVVAGSVAGRLAVWVGTPTQG